MGFLVSRLHCIRPINLIKNSICFCMKKCLSNSLVLEGISKLNINNDLILFHFNTIYYCNVLFVENGLEFNLFYYIYVNEVVINAY